MGLNIGYTWMSRLVDDCLKKNEVADYLYEYYADIPNTDKGVAFIRMQPLWAAYALHRYDDVFRLSDKGYGILGKWEDDVYEEYDSGHNRRTLVTQAEFLGGRLIPWCVNGIGRNSHFLQILGDISWINRGTLTNCARAVLEDMMNECNRAYECDSEEKKEERLRLLRDRMANIRTSCFPAYCEMMELGAEELLYAISIVNNKSLTYNAEELPYIKDWLRWNNGGEGVYIFREGVEHILWG